MSGIIGTNVVTQVGFIVRDIEKAKRKFAEFLGVEPPPHFDGGKYEVTGTTVEGRPAPDANCLLAFFDVGPNVQIELIQPNGAKSTWQDFLDTYGEGIHHIAFNVKNMDSKVKACEDFGMKCLQRGRYGDGNGEYAYMDARSELKCIIELLESY
ncbi:MAG: VOC family protein [Clostridiaceae bacterium]|jgi:methylmalonyl-CoA/ethylmalonyl-CoA epimerase|nr:VOC family protein [Clostridiaceae bacterium]